MSTARLHTSGYVSTEVKERLFLLHQLLPAIALGSSLAAISVGQIGIENCLPHSRSSPHFRSMVHPPSLSFFQLLHHLENPRFLRNHLHYHQYHHFPRRDHRWPCPLQTQSNCLSWKVSCLSCLLRFFCFVCWIFHCFYFLNFFSS